MIAKVLYRELKGTPLSIVDVGASGGLDKRWSAYGYFCKAVLFEPDDRAAMPQQTDRAIIINTALSNKEGEVELNICRKQEVSSLYEPNLNFLQRFPDKERFTIEKKEKVSADTLDSIVQKLELPAINFIKIDAQGHELPILQGAKNVLKNAVGLEVEVEFQPMYKDQPLFADVDAFVRDQGFELFDLKRYYMKRKGCDQTKNRQGQIVFGDALYFRVPEVLLADDNIGQVQILHALSIYMAYGYIDLAITLLEIAAAKCLIQQGLSVELLTCLKKSKYKKQLPDFKGKGRLRRILMYGADRLMAKSPWAADRRLGG